MKKFVLCLVLLLALSGEALFSWEANDLTKFPVGQEDGNWILNFGVGLERFGAYIGERYTYIPPINLTFDRNTGLGSKKLPFFFGGHVGFSGYGYKSKTDKDYWYFVSRIPAGFRFGYHFNWGVKGLDTYAVTTAGVKIHIASYGKNHYYWNNKDFYRNFYYSVADWVYIGANLGIRYFVAPGFGFWAEVGWLSGSFLNAGLSFKF